VATIDRHWRPAALGRRRSIAPALRIAGRASLGVGLFMLGFVMYELFVTSYFAGRAQTGLAEELESRIASVETEVVVYQRGTFELTRSPIEIPADLAMPEPAEIEATLEVTGLETVSTGGEETVPAEEEIADAAALAQEPEVPAGSIIVEAPPPESVSIGQIEIPSIGVDWTVVEGVTRNDLRTGAGHMPDTALPGQPGNAVISGHRTTYGAPFHNLGKAKKGDLITVTTASGSHVYQIVEKRIVEPNETWVTGQWEGAWLTLTTCHPKFSSSERLVVFARLVGGPNASALAGEA
jgi:LPXTG-site transpeptidase (sortase) family protein